MTNLSHSFHKKKFNKNDFFLEVEVTKSLYSAMSKIPINLKNPDNSNFLESDAESDVPSFINNSRCRTSKHVNTIIESNKKSNEKFCNNPLIEWEPFVELGAISKLLTALKPECLKFTESTESCFREIIFRLEKLLEDWARDDRKIKNLLANDNSLVKCEQCGVISIRKRKCYRGISKPLDRSPQNFKTQSCLQRLSKGRFENSSYSKVYEEKRKLNPKDEQKSNFDRNVTIRDDERYKRSIKSDLSNIRQFSHLCGSTTAEREIDPFMENERKLDDHKFDDHKFDDQKFGIRKFDKYSDRPLIEVSAPPRKVSNIPRSNARLAQVTLNRKINRRNMEIIPKEIKVDSCESNDTITKISDNKDRKEDKNNESEILNESEHLVKDLNHQILSDNVYPLLLKVKEGPENSLNLEFPKQLNDFLEIKKLSQKQLQNDQDQFEQYHDKRLAKGDCSSFHEKKDSSPFPEIEGLYLHRICGTDNGLNKKKDFSPLPEIEGLYPHRICGPDHGSHSGSVHWILNKENHLEKSNIEAVIQEISCMNTLKTSSSAENILQSQLEENKTIGLSSSSAENLIHEWIIESLKKSIESLKENKSLEKTLQSTGIQTVSCSSHDIIRRIRAQITEAIDKFAACKLMEVKSNRVDLHENKTSNQETNQEKELQMSYKNPSTVSSSLWEIKNLGQEHSEILKQHIASKKLLSSGIVSTISLHETTSKIFSVYSNIVESSEEMDWETFEQLVETLQPTQRQLWRDICIAVKNEAKRVAEKSQGLTEVCIEIKCVPKKKKRKEKKDLESGDEVAFELDMTLKDMENFLEKRLRSCLFGRRMKKMINVEESLTKKG